MSAAKKSEARVLAALISVRQRRLARLESSKRQVDQVLEEKRQLEHRVQAELDACVGRRLECVSQLQSRTQRDCVVRPADVVANQAHFGRLQRQEKTAQGWVAEAGQMVEQAAQSCQEVRRQIASAQERIESLRQQRTKVLLKAEMAQELQEEEESSEQHAGMARFRR